MNTYQNIELLCEQGVRMEDEGNRNRLPSPFLSEASTGWGGCWNQCLPRVSHPPRPLNPQSEMVPPSEGQVPPFPGLDSPTAEVRLYNDGQGGGQLLVSSPQVSSNLYL